MPICHSSRREIGSTPTPGSSSATLSVRLPGYRPGRVFVSSHGELARQASGKRAKRCKLQQGAKVCFRASPVTLRKSAYRLDFPSPSDLHTGRISAAYSRAGVQRAVVFDRIKANHRGTAVSGFSNPASIRISVVLPAPSAQPAPSHNRREWCSRAVRRRLVHARKAFFQAVQRDNGIILSCLVTELHRYRHSLA